MEELERIEKYLIKHNIYPEYIVEHTSDWKFKPVKDALYIMINGDWKHDHLRCNWLMNDLNYDDRGECVIGDEDSDFYTAVHAYVLLK